jgi:hypothetical protein
MMRHHDAVGRIPIRAAAGSGVVDRGMAGRRQVATHPKLQVLTIR